MSTPLRQKNENKINSNFRILLDLLCNRVILYLYRPVIKKSGYV